MYAVEEGSSSDSDTVSSITHVNRLNKQGEEPARVTPKLNGKSIPMEIDTGSPIVFLLSYDDYKKYFKGEQLKTAEVNMRAITGHKLDIAGIMDVMFEYEKQKCQLELYICKTRSKPLFGRNWLREIQLNWNQIREVNCHKVNTVKANRKPT